MRKRIYKISAAGCVLGLLAGLLVPMPQSADAKAKTAKWTAKLSKSTLYLGWTSGKKKASVTVKNGKKKVAVKKLTFKSSNSKVVSVSAKGKITAAKTGSATITVTSKTNKSWKKKLKVTVKNCPMKFAEKDAYIGLSGTSEKATQKLELYGVNKGVIYTSSNTDVAKVSQNGKVTAYKRGKTVITAKDNKGNTANCTVTVTSQKSAIHDPSVYRDPQSGNYYSFGSHLKAATSKNLIGWSVAANTVSDYSDSATLFTKNYKEEFAEAYAYTMPDGAKQNAWAPDIIYNTQMKKYCMYMTIVDGSKKCCIAMAVSDKPDGPYAYQGMIVCSGMKTDGSDIDKTNVASALGISDEEAKNSKYATLGDNSPDCIDATVFYDHNGNLWMVYGSFTTTGGIRLLKLDKATGLRGENYADSGDGKENGLSTEDPYYGKKIANSNGEGPYIQMVPSDKSSTGYYYYLWISTGNLQYYGGYNMRMMRSENPDGPYTDPAGNEAVKDLQKYALGLRVMDNYQFSFMDTAFVSQGGNSATEDGNGKTFIQFHARTASSDSFTVRTHQTFQNEDGWLVTAPYEYNGETIADSYDKSDVVGDYEFLYHRTSFAKTTTTTKDVLKSVRVTLNEDGTVTGAYTGKWSLNGHYLTIEIEGRTYKGVVLEQYEQNEDCKKVMVFTAIGSDNRTVWGSKMHKTDAQAASYDSKNLAIADLSGTTVKKDFTLPVQGLFGSDISWTSDKDAIRVDGNTAKVQRQAEDTEVTLTATVSKGDIKKTATFKLKVIKDALELPAVADGDVIDLPTAIAGQKVTWESSDASVITADGKVTHPASGYTKVTMTASYGSEKETFTVYVMPKKAEETLYEEDYSKMVSDAAIATVWKSKDKQNCLYVESDAVHESFIKFAGGNTSKSQGAQTLFPAMDTALENYVVEFDVALDAGTRDTTEFALFGTDVKYKEDDTNAGLESGYIFKLSAENGSTEWSINDSKEKFELPLTWVHVKASVDVKNGKALVKISDGETEFYGGEINVSGKGQPGGLYLRWACIQSLISVDNVYVGK